MRSIREEDSQSGLSISKDHTWAKQPKRNPPPTLEDLKKAREFMETDGWLEKGIWAFEKTVYLNANKTRSRVIHLLTCKNENGDVVDQMVMKIVGDHSIGIQQSADEEFGLQRQLRGDDGHIPEFIAQLYSYSIRPRPNSTTHLAYGFMEYCPYSDLRNLRISTKPDNQPIPEPFIWLAIQGMTEAVYLLYTGRSFRREGDFTVIDNDLLHQRRRPGWQSKINIDIKSLNVCLGKADSRYPAFKSVKMIDFGLCYPPRRNPSLAGFGTPGWIPPEQMNEGEINVEGCVANIGLVALHLLERKPQEFVTINWMQHPRPEYAVHKIPQNRFDTYNSKRLYKVINECLLVEAKKRPSLTWLIRETYRALDLYQRRTGTLKGAGLLDIDARDRMEWVGDEFHLGVGKRLHRDEGFPHPVPNPPYSPVPDNNKNQPPPPSFDSSPSSGGPTIAPQLFQRGHHQDPPVNAEESPEDSQASLQEGSQVLEEAARDSPKGEAEEAEPRTPPKRKQVIFENYSNTSSGSRRRGGSKRGLERFQSPEVDEGRRIGKKRRMEEPEEKAKAWWPLW